MNSNDFWRIALGLLITALLLSPGNCPAQTEPAGSHSKQAWEKLTKDLNLTPDKAAQFQKVGAQYSQTRQVLIENLKNEESDLEKSLAEPQPDEAKIKKLVPEIISGHNQLFESFKAQRQEEMTLLTPLQQAKYLLSLKKWHEETRGNAKADQ